MSNKTEPKVLNTVNLNELFNKTVKILDNMIYKNYYFLSLGSDGAYVLDIKNTSNVSIKHIFNA